MPHTTERQRRKHFTMLSEARFQQAQKSQLIVLSRGTPARVKLNHYADTDSLYIDLSSTTSSDSKEIADGLVVDFDDAGHVVGIDIQHASERLDLTSIESHHLPLRERSA